MNNSDVATKYEEGFRKLILRYWLTALALILLGGVMGILIRTNQGASFLAASFLDPTRHYSFMTFHGVCMLGFIIVALIGTGWLVIVKILNVAIPLKRIELVYWILIAAVVLIVVSTFVGKFAAGFPTLPPLPVLPGGSWPLWASWVFLSGILLIGVGALLFFIEWLLAAHKATGGIGEALGLRVFAKESNPHPHDLATSPAIIAITAMSLTGVYAILMGVYSLGNIFTKLLNPAYQLDAMMIKNANWMFGHTLANILFWGTFAIVYLLVPVYTGREWRAYRLLVGAWLLTLVTTGLTAFLHHALMDFAIPFQLILFAQISTYLSGIPWAAVSVYGALTRVWGCGTEWKPALRFIYLGLFCFVIGSAAAIIDSTIGFNRVLHNTLWVPAHFHSYMMMGAALFLFAAIYHFLPDVTGKSINSKLPSVHFWMTFIGGLGFLLTFYLAGLLNAPRRFADFTVARFPAGLESIIDISIPFGMVYLLGQLVFVYYVLRTVFSKAR